MTRSEVYNFCTEKFYSSMDDYQNGIVSCKTLLPPEAIDAIIDCAVEEAVEKRKTGKWIPTGHKEEWWAEEKQCSVCGAITLDDGNYCANCGAAMEGEQG